MKELPYVLSVGLFAAVGGGVPDSGGRRRRRRPARYWGVADVGSFTVLSDRVAPHGSTSYTERSSPSLLLAILPATRRATKHFHNLTKIHKPTLLLSR